MKQLVEFLNESQKQEFISIFEDVLSDDSQITLQECYEELFDKMFYVNEGLFSKLAGKLRNWADSADKADDKLRERVDNASDAAKNAIASAKKKAGKLWDKVSGTYCSVVMAVDDAIAMSKDSIVKLCAQSKVKVEEFESKCALIYTNAIAKSQNTAKAIQEWVNDKSKGAQKFAALNTLLMGAIMAKSAGIDSGMALDILASAGFN